MSGDFDSRAKFSRVKTSSPRRQCGIYSIPYGDGWEGAWEHPRLRVSTSTKFIDEKTKREYLKRGLGGGGHRCAVEREAENLFPACRCCAGKAKT